MNDSSGNGVPRASRRQFLKTTTGFMTLSLLGTSCFDTVSADSSDQLWAFETDSRIWSSPTVIDNSVFFGDWDGNLYTVDVETGNQQWQFGTNGRIYSSPTVVDNTAFVGGANNLYAVDMRTGDQQWDFETAFGSPTVADGTVFVGSGDGNLYAVNAETGNQQWTFEAGGAVSSPTVVSGTVLIGSRDNNLYALDTETGNQQWQLQTGDAVVSSPTVANNTVFVGSNDGYLYSVDIETGEQQWDFATGGSIPNGPTVANGIVFTGSYDNKIYAVDVETGNEQWTFETSGEISSSPTVSGGTVFVGSVDTNLYAVDAEAGNQQWTFETGDVVSSSPIVVDGTVFVGSSDGSLYAIDAGIDSSSEDSRVMLGTLGHHADWKYAGQSIDIRVETGGGTKETEEVNGSPEPEGLAETQFGPVPRIRDIESFAIWTTIAIFAGGGIYRFWWVLTDPQPEPESSEEASSKSADEPTEATNEPIDPTKQPEINDPSAVEELRSKAETAFQTGVSAGKDVDLDEAFDAYTEALTQYQNALNETDPEDTERREAIEESIKLTRENLEAVKTRQAQRTELIETLKSAERSFQTGIAAYSEGNKTFARIRFRQARSAFGEAIDLVEASGNDLLVSPVEVTVQPERMLVSTTLSEFSRIPEAATMKLADAGINTLDELESNEKPPWKPTAVEALVSEGNTNEQVETMLTILSWWNSTDNYEFDSLTDISCRQEQASYGFNRSS